jgi:phenylacetic acid degradation protein
LKIRKMAKIYSIDGIKPVIDPSSFVHPEAVLIGDVVIQKDCYVGPNASLRGDMGQILLKSGSNIQDNCIAHTFAGGRVVVGENANIGHGAVLHGCSVGQWALVGMNAVLMDGSVVGDFAFVGALAFLRAGFKVPERTVVGGVPAKILRSVTDEEIQWKKAGDSDYQKIIKRSFDSLTEVEPGTDCSVIRGPRLKYDGVRPLFEARQS